MTEQKLYKLYAVRIADLPKNALKGFKYSLRANNRYCLVYSTDELQPPYRELPDDISLTDDEKAWLFSCKAECEKEVFIEKVKTNVDYLNEHSDEYSDFLMAFFERFETELKNIAGGNDDE